MSNRRRRLEAIERILASHVCPVCQSTPVRIIATDPETGIQWHTETMPEVGCPKCGSVPIVIDVQSTPPVDVTLI